MAILISAADGGITAALTVFDAVSTGTGAVAQTVTTKTSYTTTTYTYGTAFTGTNLDVVDGVLMFMRRNGVLGLLDVALSEDNGTTATRSVQVNISDIPANYGWVFFKFGSSLALDGGTDYKVGIKTTSSGGNSGVTVGNSGSNNWAHILRLVSLATAAAGDVMYIVGEHTGAGATTTRTITMDQTATTDYGTGTDGAIDNGLEIGDAGILTYDHTINSYLKLSGSLNVWANGNLWKGTVANPIDVGKVAILELDPVADGGMGLIVNDGGTYVDQGSPYSVAAKYYTKLNTDEAVNSTSLGVADDTGWPDNAEVAVFSTTRTGSQTEKGTLNGAAGASSLTVDGFAGAGGGLANAHSGTSPTQAEVILLTRNSIVRSATSTIMAYVLINIVGTLDADWAEFYYIGTASPNKHGIEIASGALTGAASVQYCSLHDSEGGGFWISSTSGNTVTFSNNVGWNLNSSASGSVQALVLTATSQLHVLDSNIISGSTGAGGSLILVGDVGGTFTNNVAQAIAGANGQGISLTEGATIGTFSGNVVHSSAGRGIQLSGQGITGTISTCTSWRNTGQGFYYNTTVEKLTFVSLTLFGNTTSNIDHSSNQISGRQFFRSTTLNADPSFATTNGILCTQSALWFVFMDCSFGATTAHTNDLSVNTSNLYSHAIDLINTTLASATEVLSNGSMGSSGRIHSHKHDASSTTFKDWYKYGTIQNDTTTRHTASGYSWKLTPNNATNKLVLPGPTDFDTFKVTAAANIAVTITGYVLYDGSYNGNMPRLVVVGGIVAGVGSAGTDVTDTATTSNANNWEQQSVQVTPTEDGVIEFYFDCDGTAGNAYVDDLAVAGTRISTGTMDIASRGLPETGIYTIAAGGGLLRPIGMAGGFS